jgi:hypothetical protein
MDKAEFKAALATYRNPVTHYRHWSRAYYYTDGVAFLVEQAGARWLLDHIAAQQKRARKYRALRELQIWTLQMTGRFIARIVCSRSEHDAAFGEDVQVLGGFPLDEVTLYFENETLMLPGERSAA